MSGYEWAVRYAGGHERLWEECRRVLDAGGVAAMSGEVVLLGWLVDGGRVFYVHLAALILKIYRLQDALK